MNFSQLSLKSTFVAVVLLIITACGGSKKTQTDTAASIEDDGKIALIFLQLNDVYEVAPLENGKVGGMARVATIRQQLLEENPNTFTILAGDFLSPSVFGSLKADGEKVKGKQMVDVMNVMGIDYVTFGNHEFDLKQHELQARINESEFEWVSSNVVNKKGDVYGPFAKVKGTMNYFFPETISLNISDSDGTTASIGIFAETLPFNKKKYVEYLDVFENAQQMYDKLILNNDFVVGITHLNIEDDLKLAAMLPNVPLLMGGHDHENMKHQVGNVTVAKADANAKTVYIHRLTLDKNAQTVTVVSELQAITDAIPDEPNTAKVVNKWTSIMNESFGSLGYNPDEVLLKVPQANALDGLEKSVRNGATNLTEIITNAIGYATPRANAGFMNSGSIRVDDYLYGDVTQFDILRTLPFGGGIPEVEMTGNLLKKILQVGLDNKGSGGYLQWYNISLQEGSNNNFLINGEAIEDNKKYRIAVTSFLLTGGEKGLEFLTPDNPEITNVWTGETDDVLKGDIRKAVIAYLQSQQ